MNRASRVDESFNWVNRKSSVYALEFVVPSESRGDFFASLQRYAQANNFEYKRSRIHPVKEQFSIDFSRSDVAMSGANIWELNRYQLAFYIDEKRGGSLEKVQQLADVLGRDIRDVPGVVVTRSK